MDYLNWRGDLTLEADPFNEVDNLILAYLSYAKLEGAVPAPGEGEITIQEAAARFFALHTEEEIKKDKSFVRKAPYLLQMAAESERFGHAKLCSFVDHVDTEKEIQFAALEIRLDDGTSYISYRGTDDTIVGWKEDFRLCNGVVPAEQEAAAYLQLVGSMHERPLRIGGHSKGGNLAIYASADCGYVLQDRIEAIYNNDGPGLSAELLMDERLQRILPKIVRIIPESSVIGMLLEHKAEPLIIKSSSSGVMQHDGLSWQVMGNHFERAGELSSSAKVFDTSIRSWINGIEPAKRTVFIDDLFSVLEASGCETLTELQNSGLKAFTQMLRAMEKLEPETGKQVTGLLRIFADQWTDSLKSNTPAVQVRLPLKNAFREIRMNQHKKQPPTREEISKCKAVIFDMDGTLVDSMWMWYQIDVEYLGRFGIEPPEDLQTAIEGMSFSETAVHFKERFQIPDSLDQIKADWNAMAAEKYRREVPFKAGAEEFLQWCKAQGIRLGVATSNSRQLVDCVSEALPLKEYMDQIITACEVAHGKPAPDVYLEAAKRLGVAPEECMVFEDLPAGILAGQAAGMKVCAVEDAYSKDIWEKKAELAEYYIDDYTQIR